MPMDFVHAPACTPADAELATIKINVDPSRASVFVDGRFVGHVGDFGVFGASHARGSGVTPYPDRTSRV